VPIFVTLQNFAVTGQTVAEIWRFFDFSRRHPSPCFQNMEILKLGRVKTAKMRHRVGRIVAKIWRFFFKMAATAILDFKIWEF